MVCVFLNTLLGIIMICEHSAEDAKTKRVLWYAKLATTFALIGLSFSSVGLA